MRSASVVLLALALAVLVSSFALAYDVVDGHPRLFFLAADIPELRAKCSGPLASEYQLLKSYCDGNMYDSLPFSGDSQWERDLAAYSFMWLMSGDADYADRAKQIAQSSVYSNRNSTEEWVRGGSLFFDWCHSYLTPSERNYFGNAIADGGEWWIDRQNWATVGNYHPKHGWLREFAYSGLALYNEGIRDATARALCDTFYVHTFGDRHTLCCYDEIAGDGSYFEGPYNRNRLYMDHREGLDMWEVASDPKPYTVSGNFRNLGKYFMYDIGAKQDGPYFIGSKQGDDKAHQFFSPNARIVLYDVAGRIGGGHEQWFAEEIERQNTGVLTPGEEWQIIVYKDVDLEPVPPTNLPQAWWFSVMGTVYMRSGWDISLGSNDIYAVMRCERYPRGHTHAHQNHFLIARGHDLLAIDSGAYDSSISSHHKNYFSRTIAHNTITVYDPNEQTFGSLSNDGGQIHPDWYNSAIHCGDASRPEFYRGIITDFVDTTGFTYMKGDATAAYIPSKVQLFTREIIWFKPNIFVVFDRVIAGSPSFKKKWLMHSLNRPDISGDLTTIQEGSSKLFVRTLLPDPHEIVEVGGSGHQFEVNGVNYPPSGFWFDDAGAWRMEVSPVTQANAHLFLHVLYACDQSVQAMPDVQLIDAENMVGVEVGDHVAMFSSSGVTIDSVTYEFGELPLEETGHRFAFDWHCGD